MQDYDDFDISAEEFDRRLGDGEAVDVHYLGGNLRPMPCARFVSTPNTYTSRQKTSPVKSFVAGHTNQLGVAQFDSTPKSVGDSRRLQQV